MKGLKYSVPLLTQKGLLILYANETQYQVETVNIISQTGRDKDSFCVIACLQKLGKQSLDSFRSMCSRIKTFIGPLFLRN